MNKNLMLCVFLCAEPLNDDYIEVLLTVCGSVFVEFKGVFSGKFFESQEIDFFLKITRKWHDE